jgi:hypothetical protein
MTQDHNHLIALICRLSNERRYLLQATTDNERAIRKVWVAQIEREISSEESFLGIAPAEEISDEDLLAELAS